jgi:hypothetical protein
VIQWLFGYGSPGAGRHLLAVSLSLDLCPVSPHRLWGHLLLGCRKQPRLDTEAQEPVVIYLPSRVLISGQTSFNSEADRKTHPDLFAQLMKPPEATDVHIPDVQVGSSISKVSMAKVEAQLWMFASLITGGQE